MPHPSPTLTATRTPRRLTVADTPPRQVGAIRLRPVRTTTEQPDPAVHRTAVWEPQQPARTAYAHGAAGRIQKALALTPGWPLRYLLVGFPVWWALGLNTFIFPILAVPMLVDLVRRAPIRVPPVFVLWALYLFWQIISLSMFNLSPPGTHAGSLTGRMISIAFNTTIYAAVTVILLYVVNLPMASVPQKAVARWMGGFFLTVAAGGYLGLLAPHFSFTSPFEAILPSGLTNGAYVQALVHPVAAQIQNVLGDEGARPSAPFGYTNTWGNVIGILLIWFVASWIFSARGKRRALYAAIAIASLVPVILSLNRGLWIGLIATALWLGLRQFAFGRIGTFLAGLGVLVIAAAVFVSTPLFSVISARIEHGKSNDIRSYVASQSIKGAAHSPIIGYGGTRHTNGSASSIAIGPTPDCPNCGGVATGSTGRFWSIMFNQGYGGLVTYFGFFAASIWVYRRERGAIAEAALATLAVVFVYMWFYSAEPAAPTLTMVAVGVLARSHAARRDLHPPQLGPTTSAGELYVR